MNEPERIDPRKLRPGPIRHECLPPELLGKIEAVFGVIGPYTGMTLEQSEVGFMRDMHPEGEVALWHAITAAWLAYHAKFLSGQALPEPEERRLLAALIAISTGARDVSRLGVPAEVGRGLLGLYGGLSRGDPADSELNPAIPDSPTLQSTFATPRPPGTATRREAPAARSSCTPQ
jgi:hypothetical protein